VEIIFVFVTSRLINTLLAHIDCCHWVETVDGKDIHHTKGNFSVVSDFAVPFEVDDYYYEVEVLENLPLSQ